MNKAQFDHYTRYEHWLRLTISPASNRYVLEVTSESHAKVRTKTGPP